MLPYKNLTGLIHGIDIQRPANEVTELSMEGRPTESVHNAVAVVPAYRVTPDVKSQVTLIRSGR